MLLQKKKTRLTETEAETTLYCNIKNEIYIHRFVIYFSYRSQTCPHDKHLFNFILFNKLWFIMFFHVVSTDKLVNTDNNNIN